MTKEQARLLIVDDERLHINVLNEMLKDEYAIKVALNGQQALERTLTDPRPDLILLDLQLPDMDGFEVLNRLKEDPLSRDIPVIFLTARGAEKDEARGLELGAVDYIAKPFSHIIVKARIKNHLTLRRSIREAMEAQIQARALRTQVGALSRSLSNEALTSPGAFSEIITHSAEMHAIFHYMEAVAKSEEPILITGETGVGKELFTQSLHKLSGQAGKMVAINLAGLDDATFSDALFGHKKGAFTGADLDRPGFIKQAEGGTLFLDEIGDLAPSSQIKLLRLLQERVYYPLGADTSQRMDVRIIAATNHDLERKMGDGRFRSDLFFRLSGHHIKIPPLRKRPEDIPLLTAHFLNQATRSMAQPSLDVPQELLTLLNLYHFPGNVRELRAMILDAVAQHRSGSVLSMKSIKKTIEGRRSTQPASLVGDGKDTSPFWMGGQLPTLDQTEGSLIAEAMRQAGNNQGIAASLLGISRSALNRRLNRRFQHLISKNE